MTVFVAVAGVVGEMKGNAGVVGEMKGNQLQSVVTIDSGGKPEPDSCKSIRYACCALPMTELCQLSSLTTSCHTRATRNFSGTLKTGSLCVLSVMPRKPHEVNDGGRNHR